MKNFKPGVFPPSETLEIAKPTLVKAKRSSSVVKPKKVDIDLLQRDGTEYLGLKAEMERSEARMKKLRASFEPHLKLLPNKRFTIGEKELYLIEVTKREVDLALAKASLGRMLIPYIEVIEKLDISAAEKHLGEEMLEPFIKRTLSYSLKTPDKKETEGEDD